MKKHLYSILITSQVLFLACKNGSFEFDDYETQSVYFPYQYPVRVISMGDDFVDNSLDQQNIFHIGVNVGGIWGGNQENRQVSFEIDESLLNDGALMRYGSEVKILPSAYYTINPSSDVTIPKGELVGKIQIKLKDSFYDDPYSLTGNYVIPLRITDTSVDLILQGTHIDEVTDPNPHVLADWVTNKTPKDYTLFGVKYVNPYHGAFLRRGIVETFNAEGELIDKKIYHSKSVDKDQVVKFFSTARSQVKSSYLGALVDQSMTLSVDDQHQITISSTDPSDPSQIRGSGKWVKDGDSWGIDIDGKPTPRDVMYLEYSYKIDGNSVSVKDTVVHRDRQIVFIDERPNVTFK